MIDLRNSRLFDLLPPNLQTPHYEALSYAFDRQMRDLVDYIPITFILALVERLNETLCDQVALNFNIPEYRTDLDIETKRGVIRFAFQVSARRGTKWAVERTVSTLLKDGEVDMRKSGI